MTGRVL